MQISKAVADLQLLGIMEGSRGQSSKELTTKHMLLKQAWLRGQPPGEGGGLLRSQAVKANLGEESRTPGGTLLVLLND